MTEIIIGFSKPNHFNLVSSIIKAYEHAPFSHAYLRVYSTTADRDLVYEASHGYVHCLTYQNFLDKNDVVAEFSYSVSDDKAKKLIQYCMDSLQKPYSYLGLLLVLYKRMNKHAKGDGDSRDYCSEFVARACPEFSKKDPDFVEPIDLYNMLCASVSVKRLI